MKATRELTLLGLFLCALVQSCASYDPLQENNVLIDDGGSAIDDRGRSPDDEYCCLIYGRGCCSNGACSRCCSCSESCLEDGWCEECPLGNQYCCENTGELVDVWGTSAGDVYVVSYFGAVSHFDGRTWNCLPRIPGLANAIWSSDDGTVFVVGRNIYEDSDHAAAWRLDGDEWSLVARGDLYYMFAVFGFGPEDVYFAGQDGVLYHLEAGGVTGTGVSNEPLSSIWGTSGNDLFVGTGGQFQPFGKGEIHHFDGVNWQFMTETENGITSISGCSGTDVYATTGYESDYMKGGVKHYDGYGWQAEWSTSDGGCQKVFCAGRGSVYAICLNDNRRFDGEEWNDFDAADPLHGGINAVWADGKSGVFLVGWSGWGFSEDLLPYLRRLRVEE